MLHINWSEKRQRHALDRMLLREVILKGQKRRRRDNIYGSIYRYFSVVYKEFRTKNFRKIYPIMVKVRA